MADQPGEGELRIVPEAREGELAAIRAALRQSPAGRPRPGARTAWWREGIRANLRRAAGRER